MSGSVRDHLEGTLSHLAVKRRWHLAEAARLETVCKALSGELESLPRSESIPFPPAEGQYAGVSIRWAVLYFFSEKPERQSLGAIADALKAGGATTKGQSFNSNVSAVLSVMVGKGEMDKTDEGFSMTELGRSVWDGIRHSEKFLHRNSSSPESE